MKERMSLRDRFAAQAMIGLLASDHATEVAEERIAKLAYSQADAMLAERDKLSTELKETP